VPSRSPVWPRSVTVVGYSGKAVSRGQYLTLGAILVCACGTSTREPIDATSTPRVCPLQLDMELIGSQSRFNPGSTGTAHGVGLAQGSRVTVEVIDCDPECRRCTFRGPVRGDPTNEPVTSQRCLNDVSTVCADDADCAGTGPCRFIFPPITAKIALPSCTLAYFEPVALPDPSPIQGTVDLFTGESDLPVMNLEIAVSLAAINGSPDGACVDCIGDTVPFDGIKDGTCQFGGQACDVIGVGTVIASSTSYDCAPPPNAPINIGLPANGTSTASRMWTLDDSRPACTASGMSTQQTCWCGVCDDGSPCFADGQCTSGSCGFAGTSGTPVTSSNNSCPGECVWDPAARAGTCSGNPTVSCFPDDLGTSIVAQGAAEVNQGFYITQLANLVCMPQLDHGFLDAVAGFPGPFLFEARFKVTPRGMR